MKVQRGSHSEEILPAHRVRLVRGLLRELPDQRAGGLQLRLHDMSQRNGALLAPVALPISAEELHLDKLFERVKSDKAVREVLIATPYTPEGDATAHFIAKAMVSAAPEVRVTRLARGIPAGVELEFTDANTIAGAIFARR